MSEGKHISVLMPVYNGGAFLEEAMESILGQDYREFELIVINDGSTDNTEEIIQKLSDNRIVYVRNEKNLGLIASLNRGLELAKGDFIARMDADDIALPERFSKQMELFAKDTDTVVVSSDYIFLKDGKESPVTNFNDSDELKAVLLFSPCFAHPTVMIRNVFSNKSLGYDPTFIHAEDYRLWTELAEYGKFQNVSSPLLKYRSHPAQVSTSYKDVQMKSSAEVRKSYLAKLGFRFSDAELKTHDLIACNTFIRSAAELLSIEKWLMNLTAQNRELKKFDQQAFAVVMNKFWYDSCGYTNLGFTAYRAYLNSPLSKGFRNDTSKKIKLLLKCIVRQFK
jgi:glycosyltransferase involved in cell wall biosynthesis